MKKKQIIKNRYMYGIGTIGRDMVFSIVALQLMFYLTDVLGISSVTLSYVTVIMVIMRVFDAINDPFMGIIVDNTKSRWGKYKPWILSGAILSGIFTILLFTDFGSKGSSFLMKFSLLYLLWGVTYTINDISYWSMLPSLSKDQKEKEKIGSFARICANLGMFSFVVGVVPITNYLAKFTGSLKSAYTVFAISLVLLMWFFQAFTLFGVKEDLSVLDNKTTPLKELLNVIIKNDQLLWTTISMVLFQLGYTTTTSFGLYYFKYIYGDESMYSIFALVLGVSQLTALALYPVFSKYFKRNQLYFAAIVLIVAGYILFFFSPTSSMTFIGIAGVLLFVGQAFVQLLVLMFISDTVEYGELKLGRRNDSVTLSLQPFINKMSGALSAGIIGFTLIISGIKDAADKSDVTLQGAQIFKASMMFLPLVLIVIGYLVYRKKYIIDEVKYEEIITELERRNNVR